MLHCVHIRGGGCGRDFRVFWKLAFFGWLSLAIVLLVFYLVIKSTLPWPSSEGPASIYSRVMGPEHARSASPWPLISMNHPRRKLPVSSVVNLSGEAHWAAVNEQEGTTIFFGGEATAREGTRRRQYVCALTDTGSVRVHPDRHRVSTYAP